MICDCGTSSFSSLIISNTCTLCKALNEAVNAMLYAKFSNEARVVML